MKTKLTNSVDAQIGQRIRMRRLLVGMSQDRLASLLGVTFQQVQKYEKGRNRISAGRLFDVALILGVPVSFFYAEADVNPDRTPSMELDQRVMEFLTRFEGRELSAAFIRIKSVKLRRSILDLVVSIESPCGSGVA